LREGNMKIRKLLSADTGSTTGGASAPSGNATLERQYSPVTPEEAESLPLDELKTRLRREAEQAQVDALTQSQAGESDNVTDSDADAAAAGGESESNTAGDADRQANVEADKGAGTGTQETKPDAALLARQVESLGANLHNVSEERKRLQQRLDEAERRLQESNQSADSQRLTAQHQAVEAEIARLPEAQRDNARQYYRNQLTQQALVSYNKYLDDRDAQLNQREFAVAQAQAPQVLSNILDFVQQTHGADAVDMNVAREFANSDRVKNLFAAAQTPAALATAMAVLSEQVDWLVVREVGRRAAEKEERRKQKGEKPEQRDVPPGTQGAATGDVAEAQRIANMSREEFAEFKRQARRKAAGNSNVAYAV
jgi:hypothetical protein